MVVKGFDSLFSENGDSFRFEDELIRHEVNKVMKLTNVLLYEITGHRVFLYFLTELIDEGQNSNQLVSLQFLINSSQCSNLMKKIILKNNLQGLLVL